VPHALAGALQKAGRVIERRAVEEADIHVRTEGNHLAKRRTVDTCGGMAVMQKLANVRSAAAHLFEPQPGERSQLVISLGKPGVNARVSPGGAREPEKVRSSDQR
jgi:hypothetical protein